MTKQELSKLFDEKLKGIATKKDLEATEKRLQTRFDQLFNFLDKDVMENRRRMDKIDERLDVLESQVQAAIARRHGCWF